MRSLWPVAVVELEQGRYFRRVPGPVGHRDGADHGVPALCVRTGLAG